jgi:hypothetical protein
MYLYHLPLVVPRVRFAGQLIHYPRPPGFVVSAQNDHAGANFSGRDLDGRQACGMSFETTGVTRFVTFRRQRWPSGCRWPTRPVPGCSPLEEGQQWQ